MKIIFACLVVSFFSQIKIAEAVTVTKKKSEKIVEAVPVAQVKKKLRISPVSMSVVGSAQVNFIATGGVPPYSFSASSGSLSKNKDRATLFTPEFDTHIQVYLKDSTGAQVSSEINVSNHPKE